MRGQRSGPGAPGAVRLATVFRKLELMLGSGVPLVKALEAIGAGLPPAMPVHGALHDVVARLRLGSGFHDALAAQHGLCPPELLVVLRASEEQGQLVAALGRIATALEDGTLSAHRTPHEPPPPHLTGDPEFPGHLMPPPGLQPMPPPPGPALHHPPGSPHPMHPLPGAHAPWFPNPAPAGPPPQSHEFQGLIAEALAAKASDIHLDPLSGGGRVRLRVDGELREIRRLPRPEYDMLMASLKASVGMDVGDRRRPQDRKVVLATDKDGRMALLASTGPYLHGEALTLRFSPSIHSLPAVEELGLGAHDLSRVKRWLERPYGLIVVTGPTGSGKTTTLYSMLREFDSQRSKVVTVEQPVTWELDGISQLQLSADQGLTWASAVRLQLRHDPDVLMLGEIPDEEVAGLALKAALSGHMVLTTFHADTPRGALARMEAIGLNAGLVTDALVGVLGQRLARRLCPSCRKPNPAPEPPSSLPPGHVLPPGTYYTATGCEECHHTGHRGRVALYSLFENGTPPPDRTFIHDGLAKAAAGVISLDEVARLGE